MSPDINPTLPSIGELSSTADPKVLTSLSQLVSTIDNLDTANLDPAAGIVDGQLASPTSSVWRPILTTVSSVFAGETAGTYWPQNSNVTVASGAGGAGVPPALFAAAASDVAVAGKTTRLRVVVTYAVNLAAPGITMTFGLHSISGIGGGGGVVAYTLAAALAGSTAAVVTPAIGGSGRVVSSSFDYSTVGAGDYLPGVVLSGTVAANSVVHFTWTLEQRHT